MLAKPVKSTTHHLQFPSNSLMISQNAFSHFLLSFTLLHFSSSLCTLVHSSFPFSTSFIVPRDMSLFHRLSHQSHPITSIYHCLFTIRFAPSPHFYFHLPPLQFSPAICSFSYQSSFPLPHHILSSAFLPLLVLLL